ncbi:MAG: ABC transporter permease [Bdellovibrionaceae bacterium]|nr:ABC transporter permease [Pseudobdellovibrionaceae bacterium]
MNALLKSATGLVLGLALSLSVAAVAGESPATILRILWTSGTASPEDIALSLFYATSLMFTGLAVAISFRVGLFNIGGEGQLNMGALATSLLGLTVFTTGDFPSAIAYPVAVMAAFCGGALWGGLAGWLRAYRGSHEVVVTIMLNFIAVGLLSFFVVEKFQSSSSQNPETDLLPAFYSSMAWDPIQRWLPSSPLNISFLVALALCFFFQWFFAKTRIGFEWRAMGWNARVSEHQGLPVKRWIVVAMAVAGGIAGLVAMNDILGSSGKLRYGFSPEYGFMGIAVALLARNQPLAVIPSALLFGLLHKGAADLDMETELINRDFAKVIQAIIILSVIGCELLPLGRLKSVFNRTEAASKT